MSKGIFVRPNRDGKSGMIEPEGKGKWVFFYLDQVEELPSEGLQEGMRLEFESEMHPKGPRARRVRYIGEAASASPKSLITSAVESVRASNRECGGQNVQWETLRSAAQTHYGSIDPRYLRFRDTGQDFGVDH